MMPQTKEGNVLQNGLPVLQQAGLLGMLPESHR